MNKKVALLSGICLGAGLMYVFDPDKGRSRRALARDRLIHAGKKTRASVRGAVRDVSNRACGLIAKAGSVFSDEDVTDDVLVARVRAKMGGAVSHPRSIAVAADGGHVILSGPIPAGEVDRLLSCVSSVRGVKGVESRLDVRCQFMEMPLDPSEIARQAVG